MASRVGGLTALILNGERLLARGNVTYNLGRPKRDAVVGADGVHGYREAPQTPFIEVDITLTGDMNLDDVLMVENGVVMAELASGKTIVLSEAWFAGEGTGNSEEGNMTARWEGMRAEEISA